MKRAYGFSLILIIILLIATASFLVSYTQSSNEQNASVYVGVSFCGNTTDQAKLLIDKVKGYTNLFVLDCGINPISQNQSAVQEICDYAVNAGLSIIVNLGTYTPRNWSWQIPFLNSAKEKYGDKLLSAYYDDEPSGIPLDWNWPNYFETGPLTFGSIQLSLVPIVQKINAFNGTGTYPENYTLEATWYKTLIERNFIRAHLSTLQIPVLTSDYALYWNDYLSGYDTILAQLGWNNSVNQEIALVRGGSNDAEQGLGRNFNVEVHATTIP